MTSFYTLVAKGRTAPPAPTPDEQEQQRIRDECAAAAAAERKARIAHANRVLAPGTPVRVPISWLRGLWLKVRRDEGPASAFDRRVVVERAEPGRALEIYEVRRDRLLVKADLETMPDLADIAAKMATPAIKTGEPLLDDSSNPPTGSGRTAIPAKQEKRHGYRAKSVVND